MSKSTTKQPESPTSAKETFGIIQHSWLELGRTKLLILIHIAFVCRPGHRGYIQNRELAALCGINDSAISKHLKVLKAGGYIADYGRDGRMYGRLWFTLPQPEGRVFKLNQELLDVDTGVDSFALAFFAYVKSTGYDSWFEGTARLAVLWNVSIRRIQEAKRALVSAGMAVLVPGRNGFKALNLLGLASLPKRARVKDPKVNRRRTTMKAATATKAVAKTVKDTARKASGLGLSKKQVRVKAMFGGIANLFLEAYHDGELAKKPLEWQCWVAAKRILGIRGFDTIPVELFMNVNRCGSLNPLELASDVKKEPGGAWAMFPDIEFELRRLEDEYLKTKTQG